MPAYVTRAQMEKEVPGAYNLIPVQFRDGLPSEVTCSAQNTEIIRKGFGFVQGFADKLFDRYRYREGDPWPMWKLVSVMYEIEREVGPRPLRQVGIQIFSTMPWPKQVNSITEAFRFMGEAYQASHGGAAPDRVGGWPVEEEGPGRLVVANTNPYPFWLEDGTVQGVCRSFARQYPRVKLIDDGKSKRDGGLMSRYEITFQIV